MASKLINEEFVKKWDSHQSLVVDRDTLITPSAYEAALARGLRVICRRGEEVPRNREEDSPAVLTLRLPRRDGIYVVKVQGGNASILDVENIP